MGKDIVINPGTSFRLFQFGLGTVTLLLIPYFWTMGFNNQQLLQNAEFDVSAYALLVAGSMLLLALALYSFSNGILRQIRITDKQIIDQRGFPLPIRRISRIAVGNSRLEISELFMEGEVGGVAPDSIDFSRGRDRRLILLGENGDTIAKINVNAFRPSDLERLVSVLKKDGVGHGVTNQR